MGFGFGDLRRHDSLLQKSVRSVALELHACQRSRAAWPIARRRASTDAPSEHWRRLSSMHVRGRPKEPWR
jgi:hypothetical protein